MSRLLAAIWILGVPEDKNEKRPSFKEIIDISGNTTDRTDKLIGSLHASWILWWSDCQKSLRASKRSPRYKAFISYGIRVGQDLLKPNVSIVDTKPSQITPAISSGIRRVWNDFLYPYNWHVGGTLLALQTRKSIPKHVSVDYLKTNNIIRNKQTRDYYETTTKNS